MQGAAGGIFSAVYPRKNLNLPLFLAEGWPRPAVNLFLPGRD
jgi:hypothetical protein